MLLALLVLGLSPGTWLRTTIPVQRSTQLTITPVTVERPRDWPAGFTIEGAWELDSPDLMFGGNSALLHLGEGRAIAFSDRGDSLAFTLPGHGKPAHRFAEVAFDRDLDGSHTDVEAATLDRASGTFWLAYEHSHAIGRFRRGPQSPPQMRRPAPMRDWPDNSGAEAMVRLEDGRFLLLRESNGIGLLFAGDPVERGPVESFAVDYPAGFRPTDAAQLPDGRVLMLLRRVGKAWPPFRSRLAIADPARIGREQRWRVRSLLALDGPLPHENYEAMAIEPDGDSLIVWLMSDDNLAVIQRTLLIKLRWQPAEL
jgi:hypothetical protein